MWSLHQRRAALNTQPWEKAGRRKDFIGIRDEERGTMGEGRGIYTVQWGPLRHRLRSEVCDWECPANWLNQNTLCAGTDLNKQAYTDSKCTQHGLHCTAFPILLIIAENFIKPANHIPKRPPRRGTLRDTHKRPLWRAECAERLAARTSSILISTNKIVGRYRPIPLSPSASLSLLASVLLHKLVLILVR